MSSCLLWFRQDLRLHDNPALIAAHQSGLKIVPVYILDDDAAGEWQMGGASRWWLHHSLKALDQSLKGTLVVRAGNAEKALADLARVHDAKAIYWNRCYEPWRIARDKRIKDSFIKQGLEVESFNSALLWEPWDVLKADKTPSKVFTPFFKRGCLGAPAPAAPRKKPKDLNLKSRDADLNLEQLRLLPRKPEPRWDHKMEAYWAIGERAAQSRLKDFLDEDVSGYQDGRNYPARRNVSRLSPHLHWGEISPRQVWHDAESAGFALGHQSDLATFQSELGWREFSYSLLYHFPQMTRKPLQSRFAAFPWARPGKGLKAWQQGLTGYPIVDAGMRELWETGYMHNRVRMVVGSFLVKHLRLHWHHGEDWFWDCLVDADLANNSASWQWIAGCGADAAPYFRIFNPIGQGEKFDPNGDYIRRWVPELTRLPDKWLNNPWKAPPIELKEAKITLGKTYPAPIVDHQEAREAALAAFKSTRSSTE